MECGSVPIDRLEIGLRRRHLHEIVRRAVEGARAADAEIDAGRGDQRFGLRLDQARRERRRDRMRFLGQASHWSVLKTVKRLRNGIASAPRRSPPRVPFLLRHETIGIDDGRAAFALPDMAAEPERLAKGQPTLAGKSAFDHGAPEDEDVDPRIAGQVDAFFGMASGALTAAVPQGWTQGTRPASSSAMILSVIS